MAKQFTWFISSLRSTLPFILLNFSTTLIEDLNFDRLNPTPKAFIFRKFQLKCSYSFDWTTWNQKMFGFFDEDLENLSYFGWLTSWWVQNLTVPFTPVHGIDKRRIHVSPEVITLRPTIKMKPEACSFYFDYGTHTDVGRVFRVNTFQLVILLERVIWFWKHIQRGIFLQCTNVKYLSQLCFVRRSVFPFFFFFFFLYTRSWQDNKCKVYIPR